MAMPQPIATALPNPAALTRGGLAARLLSEGFTVRLEAHSEPIPPQDSIDADDLNAPEDPTNPQSATLLERIESGDPWAWFCARVVVAHSGLEGEDWLGGCSYRSPEDFMHESDDYFSGMVAQAHAALMVKARAAKLIPGA